MLPAMFHVAITRSNAARKHVPEKARPAKCLEPNQISRARTLKSWSMFPWPSVANARQHAPMKIGLASGNSLFFRPFKIQFLHLSSLSPPPPKKKKTARAEVSQDHPPEFRNPGSHIFVPVGVWHWRCCGGQSDSMI